MYGDRVVTRGRPVMQELMARRRVIGPRAQEKREVGESK